MSVDIYKDCLKTFFKFDSFRPHQQEIISALLAGKDVFCKMATGHGKSLCYQFPAIFSKRIVLVISPLISLMEDQTEKLSSLNIPACAYNSTVASKQLLNRQILEGNYLLIYIAPETLSTSQELFIQVYKKHGIALIAVDEAHCISMWGTTFRPEYQNLNCLKELFPDVPILALTGTATKLVEDDICTGLRLKDPVMIRTTANRTNLSYYIYNKTKDPWTDLGEHITSDESIIIYCATRETTENIAYLLKAKGLKSDAYHAGMNSNVRKEIQRKFMKEEINIIVATISFGMGVDKSNIRKVIHYAAPQSCEAYVQETGRAGRDGLASKCLTFYSEKDFQINKSFLTDITDTKVREYRLRLQSIINCYLKIPTCRREYLLSYFDEKCTEKPTPCCDNCSDQINVNKKDVTLQTKSLLQLLKDYPFKYGKTMYIDVLLGKKLAKIPSFFKLHPSYSSSLDLTSDQCKFLINNLITDGHITERKITSNKYGACTIGLTTQGTSFLTLDTPYFINTTTIKSKPIKIKSIPKECVPKESSPKEGISKEGKIEIKLDKKENVKMKKGSKEDNNDGMSETQKMTYELFCSGLDLKEIALYRNLKLQTIEGHIVNCIVMKKAVDFEKIGMNMQIYNTVNIHVTELGKDKLKPIREKVGKKITYFQIKMTIAIMESNRSNELK